MENSDFLKLILRIRERFERISARQIEIENLLHRLEMERDEEDLSFDDFAKEFKPKVEQERLDVERLHQQLVTLIIVQGDGRYNFFFIFLVWVCDERLSFKKKTFSSFDFRTRSLHLKRQLGQFIILLVFHSLFFVVDPTHFPFTSLFEFFTTAILFLVCLVCSR